MNLTNLPVSVEWGEKEIKAEKMHESEDNDDYSESADEDQADFVEVTLGFNPKDLFEEK